MSPLSESKHPHHELYRRIGVVVWVSFVAAAVATALFFATFDPLVIVESATYPLDWSRTTSYSIGFFLFWGLTSATGAMVAWLIHLPERSAALLREREARNSQLESEEDAS
ncbi:hypothetical protein [Leucothrix pacifica]|uniref:Uncharacterized protein n=1 Tax=Leucothrix pacifica TaxID=1247513 RepID=A0A317CDH8_9GAMM|nr:hypothetical protein [Leucothrix pacifica]PWQ96586.1 hypothetical protein DKW60_12445 [Leucothrix pacifica]